MAVTDAVCSEVHRQRRRAVDVTATDRQPPDFPAFEPRFAVGCSMPVRGDWEQRLSKARMNQLAGV